MFTADYHIHVVDDSATALAARQISFRRRYAARRRRDEAHEAIKLEASGAYSTLRPNLAPADLWQLSDSGKLTNPVTPDELHAYYMGLFAARSLHRAGLLHGQTQARVAA